MRGAAPRERVAARLTPRVSVELGTAVCAMAPLTRCHTYPQSAAAEGGDAELLAEVQQFLGDLRQVRFLPCCCRAVFVCTWCRSCACCPSLSTLRNGASIRDIA
jgi:hypothetical protein